MEGLQCEARSWLRFLQAQEQRLKEFRSRHERAQGYLRELEAGRSRDEDAVEQLKRRINELHSVVFSLREACAAPTRLRKETTFLRKMLDQEGGKVVLKRHFRSLESARSLYAEAAAHAPALQPLAGRVKSDWEVAFARYVRLEEAHGRGSSGGRDACAVARTQRPSVCGNCSLTSISMSQILQGWLRRAPRKF